MVIPCLNDGEMLDRCLRALARQSLSPTEVLVVDNGSVDETAAVARRYGARLVREYRTGIAAAASAGYDAARGEIIARCDADSLPPPFWVECLAGHFASEASLAAVTGPGRFYDLPAGLPRLAGGAYMRLYFACVGAALAHPALFGSNMAFRADAWHEVRNTVRRTDPDVHDDMDLSFALGPLRRIRYDPQLWVGISPRALVGWGNWRRRIHRAIHTLAVQWRLEPPWERWSRRAASSVGRRRTKSVGAEQPET